MLSAHDGALKNLLQHKIIIRTVRVMACRALRIGKVFMHLPGPDLCFIVAVETEFRRLRNKEKRPPGSVGLVADAASARGDRTMHVLFVNIQIVAVQAQCFQWQYEPVAAPSLMTCVAHMCGVRAMEAAPGLYGLFVRQRSLPFSIRGHCSCGIDGFGHTVKKKAQSPVPRLRRTSGQDDKSYETSDE
jgi:hypothetical protein